MNSPFLPIAGWLALGSLCLVTPSLAITVPGTANPWLAGSPNGTTAASGDQAPDHSPVLVNVGAGDELRFFVYGQTGYSPGSESGPEGVSSSNGFHNTFHSAENGIGPISNAPANALIGVFLDDSAPAPGGEPEALDFTDANKDYTARLPYLRQPFFIGNGLTSSGTRQVIYVPDGATRLFLGTMDGTGWFNNTGSLNVTITVNDNAPGNGITWQPPSNITGPQDVITSGTLVAAHNVKGSNFSNDDVIVNGVTFTPFLVSSSGGQVGAFTLTGGTTAENAPYSSTNAPFSALDIGYQTMLSTALGVAGTTTEFQLILDGLTVGETYKVQLWVNESEPVVNPILPDTEYRALISADLDDAIVDRNTTNANGGTGQFVIGTFTANSPSKVLRFSAQDGGYPVLNAFQLRTSSATSNPEITDTFLPPPGTSLTVSGGTAPYTFEVVGGALPVGMTLSSEGLVGGAPTQSGNGFVTIKVTDVNGLYSGKTFDLNVDIRVPELTVKRVFIDNLGGTARQATFEVIAGDDLALAPDEVDPLYTHGSHAIEYRYRSGTGAFTPWETTLYYPFTYPPRIAFDSASVTRVELRAIDAAGNRSRVTAFDLAKNIAVTTPPTFGASVGTGITLISNAGTSIVKLFAEDLNGDLSPEVGAVDRTTGKISVIYTSNTTNPAANKQTSLIVPDAPILDAAVGKLLPLTGVSDVIPDFALVTSAGIRIVMNNRAAAPVLKLSPGILTMPGDTITKVAVGDVNGDGFDDIIAVGENAGTTRIAVFTNRAATGTAGFSTPSITLLGLESAHAMTTGDINGDGVADVLVAGHDATHLPGDDVLCYLGQYNIGLSTTATSTFIGEHVVDLKVADYTQHLLGRRDVIVGTVEGPDATYPTATHMAKHRVLVHQGGGIFNIAPARRLAALNLTPEEEISDKAVFNIAVGALTDRVLPDIVGCQYSSTGGGGSYDAGFLPPASAMGELNWMEGNDNGVIGFGTSTGKTRRIALANITGNGLLDVILANADTGNIELQTNTKFALPSSPTGAALAPSLKVPTLSSVIPGGRISGATTGISLQPWTFQYVIGTPPPDLVAKVEFQIDNGPWSTLPGGTLTRSGNNLKVAVPQVPVGLLRFRCWASSPGTGLYDTFSTPSPYIRSIITQTLVVTSKAEPESDPVGNVSTHDTEFMTYRLTYSNTGTAPAQDVVLAGAIPANTTYGGTSSSGASAGFILDSGDPAKVKVVSWNLGTLPPGATGEKFYFVQVKSTALAVLKGKAIELKAMSAASLASPATTAASFTKTTGTAGTFGIYSSAPAPGFKPQAATGSTVSTVVVPPLTMTQVVSSNSVTPGSLVDVEIILRNYAANAIHNIKVEDFIEPSFVVEGVRLRTPGNATTGPFNGILDTDPRAANNPSLQFRTTGRFLSWNVGTLDGVRNPDNSTRPPGEVRIQYRLRVRYDVDPQQLVNDVLVARSLDYGGLTATGNPQGTSAVSSARTDIMPRVATNVAVDPGLNPPKINFVQDTVPLNGTNPLTATEPAARQEMNVGGEDMAVVAEGGLMRVKLRYANTGGSVALRSVINYTVPTGTQFSGFIRENGVPSSLASNYEFFDSKDLLIPSASLAARIKEVRRFRALQGNLAANSEGVLDFILAAYSPPVPKPVNEKITPAGTVIKSVAYTMETDSLVTSVQGSPEQVPVFVARPVSFDIESRPDQGQIVQTLGIPQDVRFFISFRNNGWTPASNVKVQAAIPVGTTLISSQRLNSDLTPAGNPGTPLNAKNVVVANQLATKVEFNVGSLASGYENNPTAFGYAEMIVRVASPLPTHFPKDGRLKQRSEITGTDSVTGKRAQGSYSLFSMPAADDVKVLSSASLSEVKFLPSNAKLFAGKQLPSIVRPGQLIPIIVFFGNTGDTALTNVKVAVQVPWGSDFVGTGTTPGFTKVSDTDQIAAKKTPNVYRWTFPTLSGHSAKAVTMIVRVQNKPANEGKYMYENSAVVTGVVGTTTVERIPGNARMLVLSTNPVASAWQWWGAQLQAIGSNLFGHGNAEVKSAVSNIGTETRLTAIAGADLMVMPNGAFIVPLQSGNVLVGGGGSIITDNGAGLVIAGGALNSVAGSAGHVIAAGAGNFINVTSVGLCTPSNLSGIVSGGAGNIIASGGGNLIANDGASLIANDGASLGPISLNAANVIAAGGGNVVASGGGNIIASGGGNVVASGGGNVTENLVSSRPGAAIVPTANGFIQSSSLIANDGASILSDQGGGLIANDGASLIANDGASLIKQ